jgi:Phytoene/squalene synthetase
VGEIYAGEAPRRHEVVTPLAAALREAGVPFEDVDAYLDARSWDLQGPCLGDDATLHAWLDGTAGRLTAMAARLLGAEGEARAAARAYGRAAGAGALIRALPRLYARGGDPIPTEGELDRNALAEGRTPETLRVALRGLAEASLARLEAARATEVPEAVRPAFLSWWRAIAGAALGGAAGVRAVRPGSAQPAPPALGGVQVGVLCLCMKISGGAGMNFVRLFLGFTA